MREDYNCDGKTKGGEFKRLENDVFFDNALDNLKMYKNDIPPMRNVEILALINAAKRRGKLELLDSIMMSSKK